MLNLLIFCCTSKLTHNESIDRKEITFYGENEILTRNYINSYSSKLQLEIANVHEGITGIDDSAFSDFRKLSSVYLPSSCQSVGDYSFRDCTALKSLTLPEGLVAIYNRCFFGAGLVNITFPSTFVQSLPEFAFFGCNDLQNIFVASNNTVYSSSEDHSIMIKDGNIAVLGYGASNTIRIPCIVEIGPYFLNQRLSISKVDFSEAKNLKKIGEAAFRFTSIQRIKFPQGIVSITNMFQGQSTIQYAYLPSSLEDVGTFFKVLPTEVVVEKGCKAVNVDDKGIIFDNT